MTGSKLIVSSIRPLIYNQIKLDNDCNKGACITDGLQLLIEQGNCLASTFPSSTNRCPALPDNNAKAEAAQFKVKEAPTIFQVDDTQDCKIHKTRKMIANGFPVLVGMEVTNSFLEIQNGQEFWTPSLEEKTISGVGHAMVVVGYDMAKDAFELMNSHGPSWGDEGFIWIKTEHFGRLAKYALIMIIPENTQMEPFFHNKPAYVENNVSLKGTFIFQHLIGYKLDESGNEIFDFRPAKSTFDETENSYELRKKNWKAKKDVFQLLTKDIPAGKSVYVFSIDAANKVEVHWPSNRNIDHLQKIKSSSIVPNENAEIIIPGREEGLLLAEKGEDFLCILYCDKPIKDFDVRMKKVDNSSGTFKERLNVGFGNLLIPPSDIRYSLDRMSFTCNSSGPFRYVVPLILTINAH